MDSHAQQNQGNRQLEVKAAMAAGLNIVKLSVGIQDPEECPPTDVCCVVDISGSMGASCAGINDGKTEYVELGYSLIDLVKHALKTILKVLRPQDRLALILFDDVVETPFDFMAMNDDNRNMALTVVELMEGRNSTNIYLALETAMKLVQARADKSRNASILFFTDGQANFSPKTGEVAALKELKQSMNFVHPIHTMGFGQYNRLNSQMLHDIAYHFDGMFGYIPDPTNIGTIFVNGISNIMTQAFNQFKMNLKLSGDLITKVKKVHLGFYQHQLVTDASSQSFGTLNVNFGALRYGQDLDILLEFEESAGISPDDFASAELTFETNGELDFFKQDKVKIAVADKSEILPHLYRYEALDLLQNICDDFKGNTDAYTEKVKVFMDAWQKHNLDDEFSEGLNDTLTRQTLVSLGKDKYMEKWGAHQYRQLIRSLNIQVKNNFRDPCLANFGGNLFNNVADSADDIYNSMDPPKPSRADDVPQKIQQQVQVIEDAQQFAQVYNNNDDDQYYGGGGGCFSGDSLVQLADGAKKMVKELKKGDILASGLDSQSRARVLCVVKTYTNSGLAKMCRLSNNLLITPGHPVYHEGKWQYPRDIVEPETVQCEAIYNLVVDQDHIVSCNSIPVILLGHNYHEGILKHEYLGSQKVVDDLKAMPGWSEGLIQLNMGSMKKDVNGVQVKLMYNSHNLKV